MDLIGQKRHREVWCGSQLIELLRASRSAVYLEDWLGEHTRC